MQMHGSLLEFAFAIRANERGGAPMFTLLRGLRETPVPLLTLMRLPKLTTPAVP
jgi:hypothetical protein